ncbi:alginate lyase family protein [Chitinophaga sp.]|uniref:alginate lyase family protein n=1 Tax=Chitinophaga sp. TaxID=1869181 RepID=UPI0031D97449
MKHALLLILCSCYSFKPVFPDETIVSVLRRQVLSAASWALKQAPVTVTSASCNRSAGGLHDFYSEGDYWWPVPGHPDSPYVQRDGMTNPANFVAHRLAMIRFSCIVGALASAYRITGDSKYVLAAQRHLKAWFTDPATCMYPDLLYAQAIKGRFTGRGIGIIDTIHLMEVAQGVLVMQDAAVFDRELLAGVRKWFREYLQWLTSHQYGKDEMNAKNNHGTCWVMQVAAFARLTGDSVLLQFCRKRYMEVLLPGQMAKDGSFPLELARTKPYGYSLFNLDAMVMICQILSDSHNDLWHFQLPDGRSIRKGIEYMYPYVADKHKWPYKADVMYWDEWPVAPPFLVFGANTWKQKDWFDTWKRLDHQPEHSEVIRNLPIRYPLIWL